MSNDPRELSEIYQYAMKNYDCGMAEQAANLARATAEGDFSAQVEATQQMASIRAQRDAFHRNAIEHAQAFNPPAPQAPTQAETGLPTPDEVAGFCKIDAATYNRGVAKLMKLKAEGHYKE